MNQEYIREISLGLIAKTLRINFKLLILGFIPVMSILIALIVIYTDHQPAKYTTTGVIQVNNLYPISYSDQRNIDITGNGSSSGEVFTPSLATNSETVTSLLTTEYILKKVISNNLLDVSSKPYYNSIWETAKSMFSDDKSKSKLKVSKFDIYDSQYINQDFIVKFMSNKNYELFYNDQKLGRGTVGQPLTIKYLTLIVNANNVQAGSQFLLVKSSIDTVIANLVKKIDIDPIVINKKSSQTDTGIIKISMTGFAPDNQAILINDIIDEVRTKALNQQRQAISQTIQFLETQIKLAKDGFDAAQNALVNFQNTHSIVDIDEQAKMDLSTLTDLDLQILNKQITIDQFKTLYTDKHPLIIGLKRQKESLIISRGKVEKDLSHLPSDEANYANLKRRVDVDQQFYLLLLSKDQNLKIAYSGITSPVQILNYASPIVATIIEPISNKLIASCFVGILLLEIFLIMYFTLWANGDPHLFPYMAETALLAIIPHKKDKQIANMRHPAFNIMATYFLDSLSRHQEHLVCNIGSISDGSGKSFLISELIKYFNVLDKKSLYLEFGGKRDAISVSEALAKLDQLEMAKLEKANFLRLRINAVSHLDIDKLQEIILKLGKFNFVFIESPAILRNPLFMNLTKICNENIVVTTPNDKRSQIEMVSSGFNNLDIRLTRIIFNHPKRTIFKSVDSLGKIF